MEVLRCAFAAFLLPLGSFVVSPTLRSVVGLPAIIACALSLVPLLVQSCRGEFGTHEVVMAVLSGVGTGLPFAVLLEGYVVAGRAVDTLRGSQHAEAVLPHLESRGSALEQGLALVLLWCALEGGGYTTMLGLLSDRFAVICAYKEPERWEMPLTTFAVAFSHALLAVAPAILAFTIVEVAGAMLGRVEPRGGAWGELTGVRLVMGLLLAAILLGRDP